MQVTCYVTGGCVHTLTQQPQKQAGRSLVSLRCLPLLYHTHHSPSPVSAAEREAVSGRVLLESQPVLTCSFMFSLAMPARHRAISTSTA